MKFLTPEAIDVDGIEGDLRGPDAKAVVSFQGVVRRDRTEKGELESVFYESYDVLAEKEMSRILAELAERYPGAEAMAHHRTGRIPVGETTLLLIVSAPEREAAFEACHFALEQMKNRVPLWKKDVYKNGEGIWSHDSRETMLISDTVLTIPQS